MMLRRNRWIVLALLLTGCQAPPPDMDQALNLYRAGKINEARYEMGRYIRLKPFNPEVETARQHILLVRRIKTLEARMVQKWKSGDVEGTRRTAGVIRFLHSGYVDSAHVFALLAMKSPVEPLRPKQAPEHVPVDKEAETRQAFLRPLIMDVVERQEILALQLAQQWEERRQSPAGREPAGSAEWNSDREKDRLVVALDSAYLVLRMQSVEAERIAVDRIAAHLEQMLSSLDYPAQTSPQIEELEWQSLKHSVFSTVLDLKSHPD